MRQVQDMTNGEGVRVLDRLLDPLLRCLTPESARAVVALRADAAAQARIAELADKCSEGLLTLAERREYEVYVQVGDMISILQAKARLLLRQQTVG
jgi:hypothetical protein